MNSFSAVRSRTPGTRWAAGTKPANRLTINKATAAPRAVRAGDKGPRDRAPITNFAPINEAAETAAKHFAGADDLMLLTLESEALGPQLKWEPSRGGALFPHLYGPLRLADVIVAQDLPLIDGTHSFPEGME